MVKALAGRFEAVYEDHGINPFWEAFYTEPSAYTFETEVTFLLQHYHFAKRAGAGAKTPILMDHSFELDIAYAEMGLVGDRKEIFRSIYRELRKELGEPNGLVFLACGAEEAAGRIRARGRPLETELPLEFLSELQGRLERRIEKMSERVPVLRVNSEVTDFRERGSWVGNIVADLEELLGCRRHCGRQGVDRTGARKRVESNRGD